MYKDEHTRIWLAVLKCPVTLITFGGDRIYPNRKNWLNEPILYNKISPEPALFWWKHENWQTAKQVYPKSDTLWKYKLKIRRLFKNLILSLTRCKKLNSKSRARLIIWFQIWLTVNFSIRTLTRCIFFNPESDALFFFKLRIWRVVWFVFQNLTRSKSFVPKHVF